MNRSPHSGLGLCSFRVLLVAPTGELNPGTVKAILGRTGIGSLRGRHRNRPGLSFAHENGMTGSLQLRGDDGTRRRAPRLR